MTYALLALAILALLVLGGGGLRRSLRGQGAVSVLFCLLGVLCLLWFLVRQVLAG